MNKYFFVGFLVAACALSTAGAQTFRAPVNDTRQDRVRRPPAPVYSAKSIGAFPRAARGGNPLQLINPRAPQKYYGAPQDTVTAEDAPQSPQRNRGESPNSFVGVVLFGLRW